MARFVRAGSIVHDTHGLFTVAQVERVAQWLLYLSLAGLLVMAVIAESHEHTHTDKVSEITGTRKGSN